MISKLSKLDDNIGFLSPKSPLGHSASRTIDPKDDSLVKVNSIDNLKSGGKRLDPDRSHAATLGDESAVKQSNEVSMAMLNNPSNIALNRETDSINEQVRAFLKNDPSATHLGDIGTIAGGTLPEKRGKSVKRLGSLQKIKGLADSSTKASTLLKKHQSKINYVENKYLVNMPSSLNMNSKLSKSNMTPTK